MHAAQVKLLITGRVQGVFYRQSARESARSLGLAGWVRNLDDGSVEILAEGAKQQLMTLIEWCRVGPPHARVDNVVVEWQQIGERQDCTKYSANTSDSWHRKHFKTFEIR